MNPPYTEMQLDALRELANIASGTAATALSQMLGREIGLSVPRALALPLADAVDEAGDPAEVINGVALGLDGDIDGARAATHPDRGRRHVVRAARRRARQRVSASRPSARSATSSAPPT